jgi:hypothetical protein
MRPNGAESRHPMKIGMTTSGLSRAKKKAEPFQENSANQGDSNFQSRGTLARKIVSNLDIDHGQSKSSVAPIILRCQI